MDSDFCKNCDRLSLVLVENTYSGRKTPPYRKMFLQVFCDRKILAMEQIGNSELVDNDYALLCKPKYACSNIVTEEFLSKQMMDDYENAKVRAFNKINSHEKSDLPCNCEYLFEQRISDMNRV